MYLLHVDYNYLLKSTAVCVFVDTRVKDSIIALVQITGPDDNSPILCSNTNS